jgi:hypothetical protein
VGAQAPCRVRQVSRSEGRDSSARHSHTAQRSPGRAAPPPAQANDHACEPPTPESRLRLLHDESARAARIRGRGENVNVHNTYDGSQETVALDRFRTNSSPIWIARRHTDYAATRTAPRRTDCATHPAVSASPRCASPLRVGARSCCAEAGRNRAPVTVSVSERSSHARRARAQPRRASAPYCRRCDRVARAGSAGRARRSPDEPSSAGA